MRKSLWIIALALAGLVAPGVARATQFDFLQQLPGGGSINGSLTTNGGKGSSFEIISFSFGVSNPETQGFGSGRAGRASLSGVDAIAGTNYLMFNFSGTDQGYLALPIANGGFIIWATPNCLICGNIPAVSAAFRSDVAGGGLIAAINIAGSGVNDILGGLSGTQVIATATPEPASSGLMLIGAGLLGMMIAMRRR